MTDAGARYAGRSVKRLAVKGAFHGRTERPAVYSDSSRKTYTQHLASFRDESSLLTVEPYNVEQLRQIFADADKNGQLSRAEFDRMGEACGPMHGGGRMPRNHPNPGPLPPKQ